jgi:hypothetical protein
MARIDQHHKDVDAAKNVKVQQKSKSYLPTLLCMNLNTVDQMQAIGIMREGCCNLKIVLMLSNCYGINIISYHSFHRQNNTLRIRVLFSNLVIKDSSI